MAGSYRRIGMRIIAVWQRISVADFQVILRVYSRFGGMIGTFRQIY